MRQPLSEFDEHDEGFALMGEERQDEVARPERRTPALLLSVLAMALFAGGLWFAYVEGTRHSATVSRSDAVPLLRADTSPSKIKPEQPGGMKIPDQNVSIYNERAGGPAVEKLLPAPEQPMPRPAPPPPAPPRPALAAPLPAPSPQPVAIEPVPARPTASEKPEVKEAVAPKTAAPSASASRSGPIRIRLASLRSPEAAREEWARLKRDNTDLLGRLRAVAIRTDLGDKGIYYRVEAGPFADAAVAERLCSELRRR